MLPLNTLNYATERSRQPVFTRGGHHDCWRH